MISFMGTAVLSTVAIIALLALLGTVAWVGRVFVRSIDLTKPVDHLYVTPGQMIEVQLGITRLQADIEALNLAVSEGIARTDRAEKRIQKTVASARRLVAAAGLEHPGLEAENDELRESDAAPSEEAELRIVPEPVADRGRTGVPGISHSDLDRMREARSV